MIETMYEASGIGLAASQVNVHKRVLVIDVSETRDQPQVFINPEITPLTEDLAPYEEGCLSVPGFYEKVERPSRVRINALDRNGEPFEIETDGLLATCRAGQFVVDTSTAPVALTRDLARRFDAIGVAYADGRGVAQEAPPHCLLPGGRPPGSLVGFPCVCFVNSDGSQCR